MGYGHACMIYSVFSLSDIHVSKQDKISDKDDLNNYVSQF